LADFDKVSLLDPNKVDVYIFRANIHEMLNNDAAVERDLTLYLTYNPTANFVYKRRADIRLEMKKYAEALDDYNRFLEAYPNHSHALMQRAFVKMKLQNLASACEDLKKSEALGNKQASVLKKENCK
jgi:tetratricopeptide (TPR) repeat protein